MSWWFELYMRGVFWAVWTPTNPQFVLFMCLRGCVSLTLSLLQPWGYFTRNVLRLWIPVIYVDNRINWIYSRVRKQASMSETGQTLARHLSNNALLYYTSVRAHHATLAQKEWYWKWFSMIFIVTNINKGR